MASIYWQYHGSNRVFAPYNAYNLGLKGMAWDVANGGVYPDDTAVGTGSNWDGSGAGPIMDNAKDFGGVVLRTL